MWIMQLPWKFHDSHTKANKGAILAGKYCCNTYQNYIALISLAITSIRSYSGVAVMSPVLQARGPGFESSPIQ